MRVYNNFTQAVRETEREMLEFAHEVHTEKWQGKDISNMPQAAMYELLLYDFKVNLNSQEDLQYYRDTIKPNLPWADDHFLERVCGEPINPGKEWANWPYAKSAKDFVEQGQFNHNYMERYWPKYAGLTDHGELSGTMFDPDSFHRPINPVNDLRHKGIRNSYGDLNDLVSLLVKEPLTRQAWLPIFFPEDTGIGDGGRKPCTLGYQFIVRNNSLHIYYPLRSCDIIRHFRDDIYLTIRLGIWILEKCRQGSEFWKNVKMGSYQMHCTSLHMFKGDKALIKPFEIDYSQVGA